MARRSSGSGLGIGVLIIFGLLATLSKEAWVVIGVVTLVVIVAYYLFRTKPKQQAPAQEAAPVLPPPSRAPSSKAANCTVLIIMVLSRHLHAIAEVFRGQQCGIAI